MQLPASELVSPPVPSLGLYLHLPFCRSRCSYCAFYTVPWESAGQGEYVSALCREIRQVARSGRRGENLQLTPQGGRKVDTIFLGGGTPSLMTSSQMQAVMETLQAEFHVSPGAEITLEANPETVTVSAAATWAALGINRLSVGAQSFQDEVLRQLGRRHDAGGTRAAVKAARAGGIPAISLDIIAGVQGAALMMDIKAALELAPDHLSMYLLEVDEEEVGGVTHLARRAARGQATIPDDEWFASAYPEAVANLAGAGLHRYEISNFARPGHASRHNLRYWRCQEVIGFGVAAHSLVNGHRHGIAGDLGAYLKSDGVPPVNCDEGGQEERIAEAWILGLRLDRGVTAREVQVRTGCDQVRLPARKVQPMIDAGLMLRRGERLYLTERGVLLSNEVFQIFLP
jgi:oxygen-independent coproporphyrinogen-3 oxidase